MSLTENGADTTRLEFADERAIQVAGRISPFLADLLEPGGGVPLPGQRPEGVVRIADDLNPSQVTRLVTAAAGVEVIGV